MATDSWDPASFGLTPVEGAPAATAQAPAQTSAAPDAQASGDPWHAANFGLTPVADDKTAPMPTPAAAPAQHSGIMSNIAAGGNEAVASTLGLPVDLATGAINLVPRAINAVAGTDLPTIQNPIGGSTSIKEAMGLVGANPDQTTATTPEERTVRAIAGGATSAALPGGIVAGLGRAGVIAGKAVPAAMEMVGASTPGQLAGNVALGGAAGLGADQAAQAVPEPYKPVAAMAGGLLAGGIPAVGAGLVKAGANALTDIAGSAGIGAKRAMTDSQGAPIVSAAGDPIKVTDQQALAAGKKVDAAASDPGAVREALATDTPSLVPGSVPTSFQLTGDQGLGQLERGVSKVPEASAAFQTRANQQNAARVGAVQGLTAANADPAAVGVAMRQQLADMTAAQEARETAATQQAQQSVTAMGGAVPAGADQQATALQAMGQTLRGDADAGTGLAGQNAAAKAAEGKLWDAIDPDGSLAVDMKPVQSRVAEIQNGMGQNAKPIAGEEAAILDAAANGPAVQGFRDLADLRSRITDAMPEMRKSGDNQGLRRMSSLLDSVHDAMSGAAQESGVSGAALEEAASAPAASATAASAGGAPSVGDTAYTPSGASVGVRYRVREADDLTASQLPGGETNPAYPGELQPRDRTRAASSLQVDRIAQKLNPERLGASTSTAEGAPIVGPDGVVESGNGRTLAIKQAYASGGPQADAYRNWLTSQGHDVTGMKAPVLVRERTSPVADMAERAKLTDDMGASPVMAVSASERAAADSKRLPADALAQWRGGDVTDARNAGFARSFATHALPEAEQAGFMTADGQISQEGADRMRNALAQRAYGSNSLVSSLAEHADDNIRPFGGAMMDAAGDMAKLRGAIESGMVPKSSDLAPALTEAANLIQTARRAKISLADAVAQRDAFSQHGENVENILRAAYGDNLAGRMSRVKLADLLRYYSSEAEMQSGLFGANRSTGEMLAQAGEKYGYGTRSGTSDAGVSIGHGASHGSDGDQARGLVDGAPRQANAGRFDGTKTFGTEAPPLTANFDADAADRYQAARDATRERHETFTNAPGVGAVLKPGRMAGDFAMDDSRVPAAIFTGGPGAAEKIQAFMAAGGSQPQLVSALKNYAAFDLRRSAENADGTLDPAKFAKWSANHTEAMSAFPDVQQRFSNAARASETLADVAAEGKASRDAFQKSAAGAFLGDADPVKKVASILGSNNAQAQMAELAQRTANDPDARAGLQRAVVEHILTNLKGDKIAGETGTTQLYGAQLQKFIRQKSDALGAIFSPEQMTSMDAIAKDLQRSDRSITGNKLPGDTATVENALAVSAARSSLLGTFADKIAAPAGAGLGSWLFGPYGAAIGSTAGAALTGLRAAGVGKVDHLVTEAMLNPALMRTLLTKVDASSRPAVLKTLGMQLGRIATGSTLQGTTAQNRGSSLPPNGLTGNILFRPTAKPTPNILSQ